MLKKFTTATILCFLLGNIFSLCFVSTVSAATFKPQVTIGDFKKGEAKTIDGNTLGLYIKEIYKYSLGFVGILACVVMMFGGFLWITAGGNGERVGNAKAWIGAALSGLVLMLCSYTILYMINPDLVNFKSINVSEPKSAGGGEEETNLSNNCIAGEKITGNNVGELLQTCGEYCGSGGYNNLVTINNDTEQDYAKCCECKIGSEGDPCGTKNNCDVSLSCLNNKCIYIATTGVGCCLYDNAIFSNNWTKCSNLDESDCKEKNSDFEWGGEDKKCASFTNNPDYKKCVDK